MKTQEAQAATTELMLLVIRYAPIAYMEDAEAYARLIRRELNRGAAIECRLMEFVTIIISCALLLGVVYALNHISVYR